MATILDIFTKLVVGVAVMLSHTVQLIERALKDALCMSKGPSASGWFHSD
jgi:hypothetical protein